MQFQMKGLLEDCCCTAYESLKLLREDMTFISELTHGTSSIDILPYTFIMCIFITYFRLVLRKGLSDVHVEIVPKKDVPQIYLENSSIKYTHK